MDLWIRSQDKMKLAKVNYVYIIENNEHFTIYGETIDSGPIIGTYKSKERALGILNRIQGELEDNIIGTDDNGYATVLDNIKVFNMPEE